MGDAYISIGAGFLCLMLCWLPYLATRFQRIRRLSNYLRVNNVEVYGSNSLLYASLNTTTDRQMQLTSITSMSGNGHEQNSDIISDESQ